MGPVTADRPGAHPRPLTLLSAQAEREYVNTVMAVLLQARLSTQYPDANLLADRFELLGPDVHAGFYPGIPVDERSGMPTLATWRRVRADAQIAAHALQVLRSRPELQARAKAHPNTFYDEQLARQAYYSALVERDAATRLAPRPTLESALRRLDDQGHASHFRLVHDAMDKTGARSRTTILLEQTPSAKARYLVHEGEQALATERLRNLLDDLVGQSAERIFARMQAIDGLELERVERGVVGPFLMAGLGHRANLRAHFEHEDDCVATFTLQMAATDLSTDRDNDPMSSALGRPHSTEELDLCEQAKAQTDYHVFLDRKFVVSEHLVDEVRAYCEQAGTRNIVYRLKRTPANEEG